MGDYTPNGIFYKPDIGASGATEKGKFDDGLDAADALIEANKPENNKLSAFAPTTSAELASVITDKLGSGKLRFDSSVTVISGATTLTPAQAGWIGVTAASGPYTLTLPDPTGLKGLFYRVKKVDYNYNLITVAAVAGQFYYTNDEGTAKSTYNRLNTGGAEALFVTDGTNWYVFNEELGQIPQCRLYIQGDQLDLPANTYVIAQFNTKSYDIGNNANVGVWISGSATATTAGHLIDTTNNPFTAGMVGYRVHNTTDDTWAYITAYNSASDVTLDADIFTSGKGYEIKNAKFIAPIAGKYNLKTSVGYKNTVVDKTYVAAAYVNNVRITMKEESLAADGASITPVAIVDYSFSAGDEITVKARTNPGVTGVDVVGNTGWTWVTIRLISKD